ncbi:universal stress protein [Desulfovibrio mangrovi]|uniref:universal stress protein n=1 Tax=Desulfovibrio mangrovi TaxID=2976983 RepID=UPI0022456FCB|nr:universal stress protein [Desulfovibrio mangrovi]UZP65893.1 universal stress protein [Desulfovibrio mangrovi]
MSNNRILIAFDSSEYAFKAVAYTGEMVAKLPGVQITLLLVERLPDRDFFPDEERWRAECGKRVQAHKEALAKARGILENSGIPPQAVTVNYLVSCKSPFEEAIVCSTGESVVEDILRTQREGDYGTVVVGRRGVSKTEAFMFGSVSNRIVQETHTCTVWVVG